MRILTTLLVMCAGVCAALCQTVVQMPAIPYEHYRALKVSEENAHRELPKPEYWGIGGLEWETQRGEIPSVAAAKSSTMLGLPSSKELKFESPSGGLTAVRYQFASAIKNRGERLKQYQILKAELVAAYQAPTHSVRPDEVFRGQDAYVQGVSHEYLLEWRGPETIASLILSDRELALEFRQAPTSQASIKKLNAAKGREFLANAKVSIMKRPGTSVTNTPAK